MDRILLVPDRDQSAVENYTVCIWFSATTIVYIAAALPLSFGIAVLAAIPLTAIAIEIPIYLGGNSFVLMLLHFTASAYVASIAGPAFYVAWFSLIVFITNGVAWVINRLLEI